MQLMGSGDEVVMFEEKVMARGEDRGSRVGALRLFRPTIHNPRSSILIALVLWAWLAPGSSSAQQNWYYHTIHSNTVAVQYGRTFKLTYANQLSRTRQFKLSLYYISDQFDSGEDRITSDMYNVNLEFQYKLIHFGRVFINGHAGFGGYHLQAKNLIDQKHDETKFSFIGGFQGEYFIQKSALALVVDYDILYTPWSDVYEFLHLPRIGLGWTC